MTTVIVEVMPKPEILDPQGKAITQALARLGYEGLSVRQGKRFEIEIEGDLTEERFDQIIEAAGQLLANTVIEDYEVYAFTDDGCAEDECHCCDEGADDASSVESGCGCGGCCSEEDDQNLISVDQVVVATEYGEVSPTEVTMEIPVVQFYETEEQV